MADRINDDTYSSEDNKIERGCSSWYGALHWGHIISCQVDHDYAVESKIISTETVRESLDAYLFMRNQ